jgi:hypothetical protein
MYVLLLLPLISFANVEALAERVMKLRGQVEESAANLEQTRKRTNAEAEVLLQRISEIESQLHKERLKNLQLVEKQKSQLATAGKSSREEFKALGDWLQQLLSYTQTGLPLQRTEKVATLQALEKRIQEGRESAVTLATELWNLTERELKLSGTNEYRLTKIPLANVDQDAEVARIGNLHAVFRSAQGMYGVTQLTKNGISWVEAKEEHHAAIDRLLEQFRQKNTTGWFEIPGLQKGSL